MTPRARLAAAFAALAVAACESTTAPAPGAGFDEPSSVAVFRGVVDPTNASTPYRPYLAVANAGSNQLSIVNLADDSLVPAPAPLRGLVYPVPGRPLLLASGDLGDQRPDLLVVVTAGDLPWLGGSRLEVVRTWAPDGALVGAVDLAASLGPNANADVLSLVALPFDPAVAGSVTLVAALAGERIATVTFRRNTAGDLNAIDVAGAQASVRVSAPLGFQPLDLAVIPGERSRVFAASTDPIGGVFGVAQIDVAGPAPTFAVTALSARAPTRLVTAARLAEVDLAAAALAGAPVPLRADAFTGRAPVDRVFAVLDESGCGPRAEIACGLVAIDPVAGTLLADPTPAGTMQAPFRAPLPVGYALAIGFTGPPAAAPLDDPEAVGTFLRVPLSGGTRLTTGVAGVAAGDGAMSYVDLARWDIPSQQPAIQNARTTVTSTRPAGTTGNQFLTLFDPVSASTVNHLNSAGLTSAVTVTAGYTPNDRWIVTHEGILPGLSGRRAEAESDGTLALQVTVPDPSNATSLLSEVVRVWDPTLGILAGDIVVIEPTGLGTCTTFEATVTDVAAPDATRPGGYLRLGHRTPAVPAWDRCVDSIGGAQGAKYLVTVRAGGPVLVRGTGHAPIHVGRPAFLAPFEVSWQDEATLAAACPLPPSVEWKATFATAPPSCDAACRRDQCMLLQRVRLARRNAYVPENPGLTGPALRFTLMPEVASATVPRDLSLVLETFDGRAPFRVAPSAGSATDPRAVVRFDRSAFGDVSAGPRLIVPYAGGVVLDSTPTLQGGAARTIH